MIRWRAVPFLKGELKGRKVASNLNDEKFQASKMSQGAGRMYRFCAAIDRGEVPPDEILIGLARMFSKVLKIIDERDVKNKPQRIMKALLLGRKPASHFRQLSLAREVAELMSDGSKREKAIQEVADKHNAEFATVEDHYKTYRRHVLKWLELKNKYPDAWRADAPDLLDRLSAAARGDTVFISSYDELAPPKKALRRRRKK